MEIHEMYNYLYKITNLVNGKIYIGVHKTNNLDDGYMGSGKYLKLAFDKYGIDNFQKDILMFFPTYKDALEEERKIVTLEFVSRDDTYNLKEGGYGGCKWGEEALELLSDAAIKRWQNDDYRKTMIEAFNDPERCKKLSVGVRKWIRENPEKHMERMMKINKNPDKIKKMAESHRGRKRGKDAVKNIRESVIKFNKDNPERSDEIHGKGCRYIHNPIDGRSMRIKDGDQIPEGWLPGSGPQAHKRNYVDLNKGSVFAYDPDTMMIRRFKTKDSVPSGWIMGRPKKNKSE